jgi:hypothetical protein
MNHKQNGYQQNGSNEEGGFGHRSVLFTGWTGRDLEATIIPQLVGGSSREWLSGQARKVTTPVIRFVVELDVALPDQFNSLRKTSSVLKL